MNDTDLIRAFECCNTRVLKCEDCPYLSAPHNCREHNQKVIDLLYRQKAEIEQLNANMDTMVKEHERLIVDAEAEAIKEFAEKLKKDSKRFFVSTPFLKHIDRLVKELTEEQK